MFRRGIAFMGLEVVYGVKPMEFLHEAVTMHLGNNGGGGDGGASAVTLHQGLLGHGERNGKFSVNQEKIRFHGKVQDGDLHRQQGRLQNIQAVNLGRRHQADADHGAHILKFQKQFSPGPGGQGLGISEFSVVAISGEDDRGSNHRPGQGPATNLIGARHPGIALIP